MTSLNIISKSLTLSLNPNPLSCKFFLRSPTVHFSGSRIRRLRMVVAPRAGPSSSQLIFAFVFPFSLLAITAFTAYRVGDQLDQKFLEELAMNEALREAEEEEEDDDDIDNTEITREEEPALPKTRNRPKRQV